VILLRGIRRSGKTSCLSHHEAPGTGDVLATDDYLNLRAGGRSELRA